jgi:hypothetical protein
MLEADGLVLFALLARNSWFPTGLRPMRRGCRGHVRDRARPVEGLGMPETIEGPLAFPKEHPQAFRWMNKPFDGLLHAMSATRYRRPVQRLVRLSRRRHDRVRP